MSTCGVCQKELCQEEISEAILVINGQKTNWRAEIHTIGGVLAHPKNMKGIGGPLVQEGDRWEWQQINPREDNR